jgi:hypothetical protein
MKMHKVAAVVRQQNPAFGNCEGQDLRVRHGSVGLSRVERSQHAISQPPRFRYDLESDVLI